MSKSGREVRELASLGEMECLRYIDFEVNKSIYSCHEVILSQCPDNNKAL